MRTAFIEELSELAGADPRILLITGDLGFGVLDEFARRYPRQFLNAGVAEQNMTGLATGLALEGRIVFTYSIGTSPCAASSRSVRRLTGRTIGRDNRRRAPRARRGRYPTIAATWRNSSTGMRKPRSLRACTACTWLIAVAHNVEPLDVEMPTAAARETAALVTFEEQPWK